MYGNVPYIRPHNQPVVSARGRGTQKSHPTREPIMVSTRQGGDYSPEKTNPSRGGGRKRGGGVSSGASAAAAAKRPSRGPRPGEEEDEEEDAVVAALEYAELYGSGGNSDHAGLAWGVYEDDDGVAFGGGGGGGGGRR